MVLLVGARLKGQASFGTFTVRETSLCFASDDFRLPVKEALLVMTRAKSGSLAVLDARGKLAGIFTDGDFRRHMAADENLLSQPLKKVMTRNPICISENALAVEALKIFNERNIDDLIVVNAKKEPVGLVDSQDLPKLKIM